MNGSEASALVDSIHSEFAKELAQVGVTLVRRDGWSVATEEDGDYRVEMRINPGGGGYATWFKPSLARNDIVWQLRSFFGEPLEGRGPE